MTSEQQAVLLLWHRVNTSLSAFYKLTQHFATAQQALQQSAEKWNDLGIHAKHIERHRSADAIQDHAFINKLEQRIHSGEFQILFSDEATYPKQLKQLFDAPPLLFYRGDATRLSQAQIAIVGSRRPTIKSQKFTFDMAQYLAAAGYVIISGLAQGVDAQAHLGALAQTPESLGRTIGVMGTGIDVCYPKQHQPLFDRIIAEGGCIISELFPATLPHKHTFPRRNRLVAGLALGTIVTEATIKSGSLITARLSAEQGKQVFALPSDIDNANAEGCHHLIREGATLIYHPDQILSELSSQIVSPIMQKSIAGLSKEDTAAATSFLATPIKPASTTATMIKMSHLNQCSDNPSKHVNPSSKMATETKSQSQGVSQAVAIPNHLQQLWVHLDWEVQDLDALIAKTALDTPSLLSQLMELELLGVITQISGRYKRI